MYRVITKRETFCFLTRVELINWLSQFNRLDVEHQKYNKVLQALATPGDNDKRRELPVSGFAFRSPEEEKLNNSKYRFNTPNFQWVDCVFIEIKDSAGYNLYTRDLLPEVLAWEYDSNLEAKRLKWCQRVSKAQREARMLARPNTPVYRSGAVPRTGKTGVWRGYRSPKTTAELRAMQDEDIREYSRARRGCLPTQYDDLTNHSYGIRCWKRTTHDRHQWERGIRNHLKSRGKGMGVSTFSSIGEVLDAEYREFLEYSQQMDAEIYAAFEEYYR